MDGCFNQRGILGDFVVEQLKNESKGTVEIAKNMARASIEAGVQTMEETNDLWHNFLPLAKTFLYRRITTRRSLCGRDEACDPGAQDLEGV